MVRRTARAAAREKNTVKPATIGEGMRGRPKSLRFLATPWPVDTIVERERNADDATLLTLAPDRLFMQVRRTERDVRTLRLTEGCFVFRAALADAVTLAGAFDRARDVERDFDLATALASLLADGAVIGYDRDTTTEEQP